MKCREKRRKTETPGKMPGDRAHGAAGLNGEGCPPGQQESRWRFYRPLPGFISLLQGGVSSRLLPPEEGMVGGRSSWDTVQPPGGGVRYGECPPRPNSSWAAWLGFVILPAVRALVKASLAKRLVGTRWWNFMIPGRNTTRTIICAPAISAPGIWWAGISGNTRLQNRRLR